MSIARTTTGTGLPALDTQAVTGQLAAPALPRGQLDVPDFDLTGPTHLGPSDCFHTSSNDQFNPGTLPQPSYNGESSMLPPFDVFDPMQPTALLLVPPVNGGVEPTTAASTASFIASTGRKRTHSRGPPQVDGGSKRQKRSNHEDGPQAIAQRAASASRQPIESNHGRPSGTTMSNTSIGHPTTSMNTVAPPIHFAPPPRPSGMSDGDYVKLLQDQVVQQFSGI
jgi:hypothetical protein